MASLDARFKTFHVTDLDMGGVREILHYPALQAQLQEIADSMCGEANSRAEQAFGPQQVAPYSSGMDQGRYTSIATVSTHTKMGQLDQRKNSTLNAINH